MSEPIEPLKNALNRQTAKIAWSELERFYASGDVVWVDASLDLIDVAERLANDDRIAFEDWLNAGKISKVTDQQALRWHGNHAVLWAVVVDPWVLVQEVSHSS